MLTHIHISQETDHKRKATVFRVKISACIEFSDNPLAEMVQKVAYFLNDLRTNKYSMT